MKKITISDTCKKMIVSIIGLLFLFIIIGFIVNLFKPETLVNPDKYFSLEIFLYSFNLTKYIIGLTIGAIFSVIKLLMLESSINNVLNMEKKQAQLKAQAGYYIRYFLTGVVLLIGAMSDNVSLLGVVIGIILLQLSAYIYKFFQDKTNDETKELVKD